MSRKRNTAVADNGAATLEPPENQPSDPGAAVPETTQNGTNGEKKKPVVSYRLSSDRTTSIELAVWSNTFTSKETGEEYEQLSVTVARNYKDANGAWCKGGSWRIHDLPCL